MSNPIVRQLAYGLGFDKYGQLWVEWPDPTGGGTCSTIISDMRERTCTICGREWELTAESFRNQFREHTMGEWCHKTCYVGYLTLDEAIFWSKAIEDIMVANKVHNLPREALVNWACDLSKIPNEYGGAWNTPWYRLKFKGYVPWIKMGTRKRVYCMSLHDLTEAQTEMFRGLIEHVKDTKEIGSSHVLIHAWTRDQAKDYLGYFFKVIASDAPKPDLKGSSIHDLELTPKTAD